MPGLFFDSGIDRNFEKDLARMNAKFNKFGTNVQKRGTVIDNTFKTIGRTVSGLVTVLAVGAAGKELLNFSKDVETALTEVSTISQAVTNDFEGYKDAIIALSTEGTQSAKDLTDAYYDIVSAGNDGAAGLELLAAAQQASTAGFVEVGTAADGLTTVINAWGKSADEAAAVSDIFFKTVEKGKTTFPELGSNIAQVAPIAASLGVSFEEVSAAAATLTKSGTPTAQAFTQIRASLIAVNKVLGDGWAEAMTYQEALEEVRKKAGGSNNELTNMLGRVEAVNAVLGLTGKNAATAAEDLDAMNNSLGATAIAADKVLQSTDQQIKILKNNILAAFEPLGDAANNVLGDLAAKLNEAFQSGDIQKFAKVVAQIAKAFIAYKVSVIALNQAQRLRKNILLTNIKAMRVSAATGKKVTAGNLLMAKSFKSLKAAFAANPIGLLVTGLTLAIPLIRKFTSEQNEASKATAKLNTNIQKEQLEANKYFEVLKKTLPKTEERKKAVEDLNKVYPDLLNNYNLETAGLGDIAKAQQLVNDKIVERLALQSQQERLAQAGNEFFQKQETILGAYLSTVKGDSAELTSVFNKVNKEIRKGLATTQEIAEAAALELGIALSGESQVVVSPTGGVTTIKSEYQELTRYVEELVEANDKYLKKQKEIEEFTSAFINKDTQQQGGVISGASSSEEVKTVSQDLLKQLEISNQKTINAILKRQSTEIGLEKEHNIELLENQLDYLTKKSNLTVDLLEKLKIEEAKIRLSAEIAAQKKTDPVAALELSYKKELLVLKKQFAGRENLKRQYNLRLLKAEYDYIKARLKLITEEGDRVELESRFATVQTMLLAEERAIEEMQLDRIAIIERANAEILKLNKQLQEQITVDQANEIQKRIAAQEEIIAGQQLYSGESGSGGLSSDLQDTVAIASQAFDQLGEGLASELADLSITISNAFSAISSDTASSAEKASGLIALILEAGNIINEAIVDSYAQEGAELDKVNKAAAERINSETKLNELLRERETLELNQSAFLAPNYKDVYSQAGKQLQDAQKTIDDSLAGLRDGLVLTATGEGESWFGLNKTAEEYSFTLDQIINGWEDATSTENLGNVANLFDPLDLFGSAASADAMADSFDQVKNAFHNTLRSMGKVAADTANFSADEWTDFYTLLDEGGYIVEDGTKQLVNGLKEAQEAYTAALEQMRDVISGIAGSLGTSLGDSLVSSIQNGTDALDGFRASLNDVFIEMAKAEVNSLFFQSLFDNLQEEMEISMTGGGDQNWQDDLLRFYDKLPKAIDGAESFLTDFDAELQKIGFEGLTGGIEEVIEEEDKDLSAAGKISQAITEKTGSELVGRLGAIMLSNERLVLFSQDALDYAVQNLVVLNKIKENTDYLPEIADNTRKTYEQLENI